MKQSIKYFNASGFIKRACIMLIILTVPTLVHSYTITTPNVIAYSHHSTTSFTQEATPKLKLGGSVGQLPIGLTLGDAFSYGSGFSYLLLSELVDGFVAPPPGAFIPRACNSVNTLSIFCFMPVSVQGGNSE